MSKLRQIAPTIPKELQDQFPELPRIVSQLLYNRKLLEPSQAEKIEQFLAPEYHNLHSPFIFQDMQKAVDRIWQAIFNKEKIVVYGDYDADAVTANAVVQQTFRYLGAEISSYIPDRFTEGYGLNLEAFAKLKEQGAQVVITVDCGTNSIDVADFCRANNIDLIITDHHEITAATPEAFALINPKNPGDVYPDSQITGVGVAYKLAKALLSSRGNVIRQKGIPEEEYKEEWDKWLLDLVAIGTVADCHSLLGENRILVKFGLRVLSKTKWLGLRQLMENAGLDLAHNTFDTRTLGFTVAPRINAAGRLEHADIALQLLLTEDFAEAIVLSNRLEEINRRRQDLTARIVSEAKEQAELISDRKIILVSHPEWPKGLVGLAAGRLAEHYHKPAIVLSNDGQECTGSARTAGGFDIIECLKSASGLLAKFGGHKQAAGLTVKTENLEKFYEQILKYADSVPATTTEPALELDGQLFEPDLTLEVYEEIAKIEPFGMGNPKPKFLLENVQVLSHRLVGAEQKHLQMQIGIGSRTLDCIGFSMAYLANQAVVGSQVDVAGELMADSWNGVKKLKLRLIDVKVKQAIEEPF
jgi:single-stranded-DNA-specific exonuclease